MSVLTATLEGPGTAILGLSFWCGWAFLERRHGSRHNASRRQLPDRRHAVAPAPANDVNSNHFQR